MVFKKDLSEKASAVIGALFYGGNTFFLEHAYVDIKDMPLSGIIRAGVTRNYCFGLVPAYANRKTTNYGMVSDVFTHDRIIGIQYLAKVNQLGVPLDVNVAIHNGYDIGTRTVGEGTNKVTILADRDNTFGSVRRNDADKNKEISTRIGYVPDKTINVGVSGTFGKLSATDLATLDTGLGISSTTHTNKAKSRAGLDFTVTKFSPIIFQGEYYQGWTSEFEHTGYQALAGYLLKKDNKPWVDFYVRYGEINPDIKANATKQQTWKLAQTVFSSVYRFTPGAQLQLELEFNDEKDSGTATKVINNVSMLELAFFY
jgi:hypothetical protein